MHSAPPFLQLTLANSQDPNESLVEIASDPVLLLTASYDVLHARCTSLRSTQLRIAVNVEAQLDETPQGTISRHTDMTRAELLNKLEKRAEEAQVLGGINLIPFFLPGPLPA